MSGRTIGFSLEQIATFLGVVEHGSFSAAARAEGLAQPGVSALMLKLERQLGYDLFDRASYRPQLTAQGRAFLPFAQRLIAEARSAADAAQAIRKPGHALTLAVDRACTTGAIIAAITRLHGEFRDLQLTVFSDALDGVTGRVMEGECEIGLASSFADLPKDLNRISAGAIEFCIAVATGHPMSLEGVRAVLANETQIVVMDGKGRIASRDFGIVGRRIWKAGDHAILRDLLLAGQGFAVVPVHMFEQDFAAGRLVRLSGTPPFLDRSSQSSAYLAWRGDIALSPVAQRFVELVMDSAATRA